MALSNIGSITIPGKTDLVGDLRTLLTSIADQAVKAMPMKTAATLKEVNDAAGALNDGTGVFLTAADGGLAAYHHFTVYGGRSHLTDGAKLMNLDTFLASLGSNANLQTIAGRTFYNAAKDQSGIWTNSSGGYHLILDTTVVYGHGTLPAIGVHDVKTINISFPSGTFTAAPSYVDVTSHSGMLMPYANNATKDGFQANFRNVGYSKSASVDHYSWAAFK